MQNLEIKKLTNERKEALAAQYAAEATLRRVHANQKDDESLPIASVIAPLEAEIKMYKNEVETKVKKGYCFLKPMQYTDSFDGSHCMHFSLALGLFRLQHCRMIRRLWNVSLSQKN